MIGLEARRVFSLTNLLGGYYMSLLIGVLVVVILVIVIIAII